MAREDAGGRNSGSSGAGNEGEYKNDNNKDGVNEKCSITNYSNLSQLLFTTS